MSRRKTLISLVLVLTTALGVLGPQTASAKFDGKQKEYTITTVDFPSKWAFFFGTTTCKITRYISHMTGTQLGDGWWTSASKVTTPPLHTSCTDPLQGEMTVTANECTFKFSAGETLEKGTKVTGELAIQCPAGKEIEVTRTAGFQPCVGYVPPQSLGGVTYHNTESEGTSSFDILMKITGVTYKQSGLFCPGGTGTFSNGEYSGDAPAFGEDRDTGVRVGVKVT